jgi:hypothetical protein
LESKAFKDNDSFRNSDWGSDSSGEIKNEWRKFMLPIGPNEKSDLIDRTPAERISKVLLEENNAWHHGRVVLMGDGKATVLLEFFSLFLHILF